MAKKVRYNGGVKTYYPCSSPENLVIGKEYEVILSRDRGWQTDYTLNGIEGEFNSVWFDDVSPEAKVYMALASQLPVIGKRYSCKKICFVDKQPKLVCWYTSIVTDLVHEGNNIYRVITQNSTYIVAVG